MFLGSGRARGANRSVRVKELRSIRPRAFPGHSAVDPTYLDSHTGAGDTYDNAYTVVIVTYFRALAPCLGTVSEYFAKSSSSACRTSRLCGISVRVESSLSFSAVSAGRYKLTCTPVRCAMYASLCQVVST